MNIFLSLLLVILSIVGIADSGYLTYEKFAGVVPPCSPGFSCETVLTSSWASIGPIPLSMLGMLFYATVFLLAIANYLDSDMRKILHTLFKKIGLDIREQSLPTTQELLLVITTFGLLFSLYLVFIMGVVIKAWCTYCLVSAGTSTSLWLITNIYYQTAVANSPFLFKKISFAKIGFIYQRIIKHIFFLFEAETIHHILLRFGATLGTISILRMFTQWLFSFTHTENVRKINGITFPNSVGLAAGFDYNGDLTDILPSVGFGFHTIGTVTYGEYLGNTPPRLGRFVKSRSLLVNKGLKSIGAQKVIAKLQKKLFLVPTGISIASTNTHFSSEREQMLDILKTFKLFEQSTLKHAYYELNISCPNTFGGEPFTTPLRLAQLLFCLDALNLTRPLYVKMPIDQSEKDTLPLLEAIAQSSAAGVIFGNLTKDKKNPAMHPDDRKDWEKMRGNASGKPTWERSNTLIALTKREYGDRFTIIGTGGIFSAADALHKLNIGADLVQLITGMIFQGPQLIGSINLKTAEQNLQSKLH